jgi:hypothetical protein
MPQADVICPNSIQICALRVTRLNTDGSAAAGPNNAYVTDRLMTFTMTPDIEDGDDKVLVGGCDCISARYRSMDKLKGFTLALTSTAVEPAMMEMMLGATVIADGSTLPVAIGVNWPTQLSCSAGQQPPVAVEAWSKAWVDDRAAPSYPYIRWVFPMSFWQMDEQELGNDFLEFSLNGYTRSNENWGTGPYNDQTVGGATIDLEPAGGFFFDDLIPDAGCGYQGIGS